PARPAAGGRADRDRHADRRQPRLQGGRAGGGHHHQGERRIGRRHAPPGGRQENRRQDRNGSAADGEARQRGRGRAEDAARGELKMQREETVVPTVKGYQRKPDNTWDYYCCDDPKIAYVRVTQFTSETFDSLKPTLEKLLADGMRGLIMDLRFNPGGRLDQAIDIVDLFIDHGVIVSTKGRSRPEQKVEAKAEGTLPYFPMIVLVNEHSASASE